MKKRLLALASVLFVAVAMNAQTVKQEVKKDASKQIIDTREK